jgi:hypothetical protein
MGKLNYRDSTIPEWRELKAYKKEKRTKDGNCHEITGVFAEEIPSVPLYLP